MATVAVARSIYSHFPHSGTPMLPFRLCIRYRNRRHRYSPTAPETQTAQNQYARLPYPDAQPRRGQHCPCSSERTTPWPLTRRAKAAPWADSQIAAPRAQPTQLLEPGLEWPWDWPYSGPRAARISRVNAGESLGAMPEVLQSKTAGQGLSSTGAEAPERYSDTVALSGRPRRQSEAQGCG
jgi:hypothetical protein